MGKKSNSKSEPYISEDNSPLEDKVIKWLSKEGYKLEYATFKAFIEADLLSRMGFYIPSFEGKPREIDVTCSQQMPNRDPGIMVSALCECKYSTKCPWVLLLFSGPLSLKDIWLSTPHSFSLQNFTSEIRRYTIKLELCRHFKKDQIFAHSLVQALRPSKKDVAFDSLQKISNAAWDNVEIPARSGRADYLISIPCIVVEAPLFSAWLDFKTDKFIVKQVPYGRLFWSGCRSGTLVDVVTKSALPDYARAIKVTFTQLLSVIEKLVPSVALPS